MTRNYRLLLSSILGISFLLSVPGFAGNSAGNGGNVLDCSPNGSGFAGLWQPTSRSYITPLDYYEGTALRNINPDLAKCSDCGTEAPLVKFVLDRFSKVDKERATKWQHWADAFTSEARFLNYTILQPSNDYGYIPIPTGCTVEQLILQRVPQFPQDGRYLIDKALWDRINPVTKAGMILHEILYRDALERGQTLSINARYLNSILSSSIVETLSQAAYQQILTKSLFDTWLYYPAPNVSYRYYDQLTLNYEDARNFCQSLGSIADLVPWAGLAEIWQSEVRVSSIGSHVFENPKFLHDVWTIFGRSSGQIARLDRTIQSDGVDTGNNMASPFCLVNERN